ncbi:hypothetical protein [Lacticaseibacillus kribbianus]|uniref:hypothetical protein n=1 Tax=Lacticaseibacillus kribbianus TaxID=2926292 RepID=UPI001CD35277|nr:hypothetical protein [Lacticaseibacillus kribbianus]
MVAPLLAAAGLLLVATLITRRLHLAGPARMTLWAATALLVLGALAVALKAALG